MIKYYSNRIIVPWCIAIGIYYAMNVILGIERFSAREIIRNFIFPYYHLWFVLGLLSYILFTYILCNVQKNSGGRKTVDFSIVILALLVSIASQWDLLAGLKSTWLGGIYTFFRILQLNKYIFFVLGFYLRQYYEKRGYIIGHKIKKVLVILLILNVIALVGLFPYRNTFLEKSLLFTLNIPLLFLVLHYGLMEHKHKCKVIEWVGVYSYPIYLYHILVKFISSFLMGEGTIGYYIIGNLGFIVLCVMIFLLKDKKYIAKYIFGSVRK